MSELQPGTEFAGYRIIRRLGAGGMGQVYLVENSRLGRQEALKVVTSGDQTFQARFTSEARLAASLDHPNIVTVYHYGFEGSTPWFTMTYLDGTDLTQTGRLQPAEVATIVEQVGSALDYAHSRGIVHRDIKPANIIIHRDPVGQIDRVTLLDLGIAKSQDGPALTAVDAFVGTVAYTAPEVLHGQPAGPATDQYALACTAYELLAGRPPFVGNASTVMNGHLQAEPPAVTTSVPQLAVADPVLRRAMAKSPAQRYPNCGAFAAAFSSAVAAAGSGHSPTVPVVGPPMTTPMPGSGPYGPPSGPAAGGYPSGPPQAGPPPAGPPPAAPYGFSSPPPQQPPKKNRGVLIGALAAAVLVLAGGITWAAIALTGDDNGSTTAAGGTSSTTSVPTTTPPTTTPPTTTPPTTTPRVTTSDGYWGLLIKPNGESYKLASFDSTEALYARATSEWGYDETWSRATFTTGCVAFAYPTSRQDGYYFSYGSGPTRAAAISAAVEASEDRNDGLPSSEIDNLCIGDPVGDS